ncbi:MAG: hypothetical protein HY754_06730 [Nitrospirae bacterium]|nr:hypothetical protein [Nitrospirota bacterium]
MLTSIDSINFGVHVSPPYVGIQIVSYDLCHSRRTTLKLFFPFELIEIFVLAAAGLI